MGIDILFWSYRFRFKIIKEFIVLPSRFILSMLQMLSALTEINFTEGYLRLDQETLQKIYSDIVRVDVNLLGRPR